MKGDEVTTESNVPKGLPSAEEFAATICFELSRDPDLSSPTLSKIFGIIRADRRAVALACAEKCRKAAERARINGSECHDILNGMGDLLDVYATDLGCGEAP